MTLAVTKAVEVWLAKVTVSVLVTLPLSEAEELVVSAVWVEVDELVVPTVWVDVVSALRVEVVVVIVIVTVADDVEVTVESVHVVVFQALFDKRIVSYY